MRRCRAEPVIGVSHLWPDGVSAHLWANLALNCRGNDEEGYVNSRTLSPKRLRPDKESDLRLESPTQSHPAGMVTPPAKLARWGRPKSQVRFGGRDSAGGCVSRAEMERIFASACVVRLVITA
jgi:hypothetical protein